MERQKQTKEIRKKANRKRISRHSDIVGNKFYIKFFAQSQFFYYIFMMYRISILIHLISFRDVCSLAASTEVRVSQ